jgi:EF-P beta-lysylation protein EpmB
MKASWRDILQNNFRNWEKLADFLELDSVQRNHLVPNPRFALNVPMRLAKKMAKRSLDCPLFKQFLPTVQELANSVNFIDDPVQDAQFRCTSKLLQKYEGRVLLVCTSACAMHCRYCFRQNYDYEVERKGFEPEIAMIKADATLHEVILSGGDPLSLSNRALKELIDQLDAIPHIKRIRFHTRFPIGIPERIDQEFVDILDQCRAQVWFVVHSNHPDELDEDVLGHLDILRKKGIVILNQAVLLQGVNDDSETLYQLCRKLSDHGILPYYLHQLDRVNGAGHFEVGESQGKQLIEQLNERLPGYAIPKYVREIAGKKNKTGIS